MNGRTAKKARQEARRLSYRDFASFLREATSLGMKGRISLAWHILVGIVPIEYRRQREAPAVSEEARHAAIAAATERQHAARMAEVETRQVLRRLVPKLQKARSLAEARRIVRAELLRHDPELREQVRRLKEAQAAAEATPPE